MDSTFWEHYEEDKVMQEDLEKTLLARVDFHIGSYPTYGDWYRARVVNGLGDTVVSCTHRHRKEETARLCAELMIDKMWTAR